MITLVMILVALFPVVMGYDCDDSPLISGCNAPLYPYNERLFTSACNKHSMCYLCGKERRSPRLKCDLQFYRRVSDVCRGLLTPKERAKCEDKAGSFLKKVLIRGSPYYQFPPHQDCEEEWAKNCEI